MTDLPLRITSSASSHEGRVRGHNEDSFVSLDGTGLWAVADGMGGHENGEWASSVLVEALRGVEPSDDFDRDCEAVAAAIHAANGTIYRAGIEREKQMGSTIVALLVRGRTFGVFWVGDSRAYLLRSRTLHQLSKDHTQVQEMIDSGLLRPEQAEGHPMGHVLGRAVGVMETLELDVIVDEVEPGDMFLLCSDGLHGVVSERQIENSLMACPPDDVAPCLLALTLENGAPDNVTAITIAFNEPTLLTLLDRVQVE